MATTSHLYFYRFHMFSLSSHCQAWLLESARGYQGCKGQSWSMDVDWSMSKLHWERCWSGGWPSKGKNHRGWDPCVFHWTLWGNFFEWNVRYQGLGSWWQTQGGAEGRGQRQFTMRTCSSFIRGTKFVDAFETCSKYLQQQKLVWKRYSPESCDGT